MSLYAAILWALLAIAGYGAAMWVLRQLHWYSHYDREYAENMALLTLLAVILVIVWRID